VPTVDGGVVLHSGIAALPGGVGDLVHEVAGAVLADGLAVLDGAGGEGAVGLDRLHELVGDADAVVGVLEEDGAVGLGVGAGAVVAGLDEVPALASSLTLHSMKSSMSGWSMLRMTILAARRVLPPDLMTPAKASKPRMKESGPEAVPPPESVSMEPRMLERLEPAPEPHLKSMPSVLARVRMESSESLTELMKQAEHCGLV
jgi:hypothetical protein